MFRIRSEMTRRKLEKDWVGEKYDFRKILPLAGAISAEKSSVLSPYFLDILPLMEAEVEVSCA